jgi:hypothetical protein
MANQIEIDVIARDMASGVFNSITSSMGSLGGVIQGIATGNYLQAITSGFQFMSEAVSETVSYIDEVDDMSRAIGVTVEESARLIQASERLSIEQYTLQQALEYAVRNGYDVSIDGLKRLSEEYIKIQDPVDKAAYLVGIFGRSSEDMSKMMELGADGINKAMEAVNDSLVPTKEATEATKDYQAATEDLNDEWMGFKVKVGSTVLPLLTEITAGVSAGIGVIQTAAQEQRAYNETVADLGVVWYQGIGYVQNGVRVTTDYVDTLVEGEIRLQNFLDGLGGQYDMWGNLITTIPQVTPAIEEVEAALRDLDKVDVNIGSKIQQDIENLAFLSAGGGLVQQIESRIQEAWEAGAITDEEATAMFQQAYLAAQGIAIEMGASKDAIIENIMEVFGVTLGEATALIDAWLADADGKTFNLTAKINYEMGSPDAFSSSQLLWDEIRTNTDINKNGIIGNAYGGWESANTPYLVGERGPELFVPGTSGKVIPNNQLGGGGGVEIDYDRFARIIAQEFQKVSR